MRLLLVGYGRMGRMVEKLAPEYGGEVVGRLDDTNNLGGVGIGGAPEADVAIDFSVPDAVADNLPRLAARGVNVVLGTTGWHQREAEMRRLALDAGIGVVAAANFSLGMVLFQELAAQAARMFAPYPQFGAWIHEIHHAAKKDAPSGTAVSLERAMSAAGYERRIDVASNRAGSVPGTHTVGFDGPFETMTMTHTNRDRAAFAQGALEAARWIQNRHGWFTMRDVPGADIMRTAFTGVGTALVTPFTRAGALDEAAVRRLARRQIDGGVHFLVPCGTTGESPTLSPEERVRVVEMCVEEARGRVPVLAGAGGYNTREAIDAARAMERAGANGLLSVTPYYNKPTPDGLVAHYKAIADSTSLPIVVYNVPGRTGVNIDVHTLVRLSALPRIVGVKEASGNIQQMCEICRAVAADFLVLSGDDAVTLPLMAVGGRGVISVASNEAPREMAQMVEAAERGDFAAARAMHAALLPLMLVNFVESNPIPVKAAMAAMGLLEEVYRLPMVPPRPESRAKI